MRLFLLIFLFLPMAVTPAHAGYELPYVGEVEDYDAEYEDTFVHLARNYNLGFVEMRAANPYVDPWLPGNGTDLTIPTKHLLPDMPNGEAHEGIIINLADMRLYAFVNGDEAPFHTPIGVGREGLNTPVGTTKVVRKKEGPTWRPTPRMLKEDPELDPVYPPGPDNPLGSHALYLGWPTYAIHGTNRPFGIGRRISSGCIRVYPEKITQLYDLIPVGTKVTVVDQPVKMAWIENKLYMEAHPTLEQAVAMEEKAQVPEKKLSNAEMKHLIKTAGVHQDRLRWPAIRKALKERSGVPVMIARRPSIDADDIEIEAAEFETPEEAKDLIEGANDEKTEDTVKSVKVEAAEDEQASAEEGEAVTAENVHKSFNLNN